MKERKPRFRVPIIAGLLAGSVLTLPTSCTKAEDGDSSSEGSAQPDLTASPSGAAPSESPSDTPTKSSRRPDNLPPPKMTTTASGLQYSVLKEGEGSSPTPTDRVTVHYHGTLQDGTVFDSSVDRDEPATFPVNGVIAGWIEGLQLMKVGSKYKFIIPPDLAYGERGAGGVIGPNETLVFEVELLEIE